MLWYTFYMKGTFREVKEFAQVWWPWTCAFQISDQGGHNWLLFQLLSSEIHYCITARPHFPRVAPSQWLRMAGILRQAHFWETLNAWQATLAWGLSNGVGQTFLDLNFSLSCFHLTILASFLSISTSHRVRSVYLTVLIASSMWNHAVFVLLWLAYFT